MNYPVCGPAPNCSLGLPFHRQLRGALSGRGEEAAGSLPSVRGRLYRRDSHDHLAAGAGAAAVLAGPQVAEDVQDGVATVMVQDRPNPLAPPGVPLRPCQPAPGLGRSARGLPKVLGLVIVQHLPLLVHRLPALEYSIHRGALVNDQTWGRHTKARVG